MCHKQIIIYVAACAFSVAFWTLTAPATADDRTLAKDSFPSHRGVWEVSLQATEQIPNPSMDWQTKLVLTRPDHTFVTIDCFYQGEQT